LGIDQRIPDLSDAELENLHANAVRLMDSGSPKQREQAESLLPLLTSAIAERRAAKTAAQQETKRVNAEKRSTAAKAAKAAKDNLA
jgi:hypothetical protein